MVRVRGLLDRDEERRVRGTGGVCRSRGDCGVGSRQYPFLDIRDQGYFQRGATRNRTRNNVTSWLTSSKYDTTTPSNGTPGQPWEEFKQRLRNCTL